jgi:predicted ArsR family transcriptional regulator
MPAFEPDPPGDALAEERAIRSESQDARERVRSVAVALRDPVTAGTVADRADCAPNTARKHLDDLAELGVVRRLDTERGTRFVRNEAYLRWRRADRLASSHTLERLLDRLADLEDREESFQQQFDAPTPDAVGIPTDSSHAEIEARLDALGEWATLREAIVRHNEAIRIARQDDRRVRA